MNNGNNVESTSESVGNGRTETFALSHDVAARFRNGPAMMLAVYSTYLLSGLFCFVYLVSTDFEHAQMYRFLGTVAFVFAFPLSYLLKRFFLGRPATEVSDQITSRLGQSEGFNKALRETLMATPWSKYRLHRGRYKKPRHEDIMVLAKSGEHTSLSIAPDCTSISIVVPVERFK